MTIGPAPICVVCTHFNRDPEKESLTCSAFPDGIPDAILRNAADHRQPYLGDHGITFEAYDTDPALAAAILEGFDEIRRAQGVA